MATPKKKAAPKRKPATADQIQETAAEVTAKSSVPLGDDDEWDFDSWERASSEIWRPEIGEYIAGTYDGFKMMPKDLTEFDEDVNIHFIIDKDTGNRMSFVGGKMCDANFAENPIEKGCKIFVRFMGQSDTRKGNRVNNFDIRFQPLNV